MRTKIAVGTVVAVVTVICISCFAFYYSTVKSPLEQADNFFQSSLEKYSQAMNLWKENDYSGARIKLASAKTDAEEARKYMERADIEPTRKQAALHYFDAWSNLIQTAICLSDALEDYNQAVLRCFECKDWSGSTKFLDAKEHIAQAQRFFLSAKENVELIDVEALPSELKSSIVEIRTYFAEYQAFLPDFGDFIDALVPLVRGYAYVMDGANYVDQENWRAAEISFQESQPHIGEAKSRFENLKNCKTAFVSLSSSKFCSMVRALEDAISHYIMGCEYATKGDFSNANTQFEIVGKLLSQI
jgi:tetratricopeptide (TPR) repeat protein